MALLTRRMRAAENSQPTVEAGVAEQLETGALAVKRRVSSLENKELTL